MRKCLQRGLYSSISYMCLNTLMRLVCLISSASWDVQDSLGFLVQRLGGWFQPRLFDVQYWVPEDRAYLLYCIDADLERRASDDYLA